MDFETIEQAKAEILRLTEENKLKNNEIENLTNDSKKKEQDIGELRTLNQQYFLKLAMQYTTPDQGKKDEEKINLEEFAKTLKF